MNDLRHIEPRRTVLLVTGTDVESNGVGALFLRELMASQPGINFAVHREPAFLMGTGKTRQNQFVVLLRAGAARLGVFSGMRLRLFRSAILGIRETAILDAAAAARADCIWVTASTPELIWIAERLVTRGADVRITVWDPPEYLAGNLRLDYSLRADLLRSFGTLVRGARAVSVIGRAMQTRYRKQHGIETEIIRYGIDAAALPPRPVRTAGDIRIVFAGSLYSKAEWNGFAAALDTANWCIGGRAVSLSFIGRFPATGAYRPPRLELLGEKPFAETMRVLATMDIGYLPYWFDKAHEVAASTSFPGKMSAYAAAGLAVFHHAPPYTEATAFLHHYPFGLVCPFLAPDAIVDALERLVALAATAECAAARQAALREELSQEAMASRFLRFLEIGAYDLGQKVWK